MNYAAAVFANGHIGVGCHHGDAYSNLSYKDRLVQDLVSGHVNEDGSFTSELPHLDKNIILIRHAESYHNAKLSEDLDTDLTERGKEQAEELSLFILKMGLKGYQGFVSPLLRTLETARQVERVTGLSFMVSELISEHSCLYNDSGVRIPCRYKSYDEFYWGELASSEELFYKREENIDFIKRMIIFFNKLPHNSLIVTHGNCVMTLIEVAMGLTVSEVPEWKEGIANASISLLRNGTLVWMSKDPSKS